MQCKDMSDWPILARLAGLSGRMATHWDSDESAGGMPSIAPAMPANTPEKLRRAKMAMLIRRGLAEGCTCGCRGDFEITQKGRELLQRVTPIAG